MNRFRRLAIATLTCSLMGLSAAHAQATRTWVSGVGDDANPCSRTAPCKTFAGAISKTAAGGEINVLDPGGYGAVTITKAITINGDGGHASILSAGTNGVIVNAGVNDAVVLRNLSINGVGTGFNGIRYLAGKSVTVDHVDIKGVTQIGIDMALTTHGTLLVQDSVIRAATGIRVTSTGGAVRATIERTSITGATNGLDLRYGFISVAGSHVSLASGAGALLASGAVASFENNVFVGNATGIQVNAGAIGLVSNNGIYNSVAAFGCGGVLASSGDNRTATSGGSCAPTTTLMVQ